MKLVDLVYGFKRLLIRCRIPPSETLGFCNALLDLGRWLRAQPAHPHFADRPRLFEAVHEQCGGGAIAYVEFGVAAGHSMRMWSEMNRDPATRLYGFDTFYGVPGEWNTGLKTFPSGHCSQDGAIPEVGDARVVFFKGLFQDTLPGFLADFVPQGRLVVHCDADLYASTLYVLTAMHRVMAAGTILLFDDFSVALHDFRALRDYTAAYRRRYRLLGTAGRAYDKVAVELL